MKKTCPFSHGRIGIVIPSDLFGLETNHTGNTYRVPLAVASYVFANMFKGREIFMFAAPTFKTHYVHA